MNLLIDIGHPAHVHIFRNLISILESKGYNITVTVRNIPSAISLLKLFGFKYIKLGEKNDTIGGKLVNQFKYDYQLLKIVSKKKIDLMLGTSITIAHVSKITGIKSIIFDDDDDEVQPLMTKFGHPFASVVLSPDVLAGKRKKKATFYYPSYHELSYLHPNRFSANPKILNDIGINNGERFFILRFNAFKAHHDVGICGISTENKRQLISHLGKFGKVFITTEKDIDDEFLKYQLKVSPEKVHSLIYYSELLIGDSQTMTSESAVLGTPSLRSNSFVGRISYLEEEEHKYGLTYGFIPNMFDRLLAKLSELLIVPNLKEIWQMKREEMLKDKIDATAFYLWLIENFPGSIKNLNPESTFWNKFKTL